MSGRMIDIVVVAKGQWNVTKRCLDSLIATATDPKRISIVYIDHESPEEEGTHQQALEYREVTQEKVRRFHVYEFETWTGLSAIWNFSVSVDMFAFENPITVILNNDVTFIQSGWQEALESRLADSKTIVGLNKMTWRGYEFLQGSMLAFLGETWNIVGEFDEMFQFGCEDVDWCHRATVLGYKMETMPVGMIEHKDGTTRDAYYGSRRLLDYRTYCSKLWFAYKHGLPYSLED